MVPDVADAQVSDLGPFTDDDGHPGEPYLEWLAENGIVHGCNPPANTRICPDRVLNRIEAVKILVGVGRHAGTLPAHPSTDHDYFVDDDPIWGGAASGLANLLARAGVISGCDPPINRHICPSEPLQRGHIAKMLVNTLALNAPDSFRSPWTDTATRFYHRAARIAAYHGLWDSSNGLFGGRTPVTRCRVRQSGGDRAGLGSVSARSFHRSPSRISYQALSRPTVRRICLRHENGLCLLDES